jgi:intein/homing endonuclease
MGNPLLKRANIPSEFTQEQLVELAKCASDPVYFAKNYIKIVNIDDGLVPFNMWPFQEKMLRTFHENRFSICKLPRQPLEDNTPIPTPSGYKKIKDLKINDVVYDLYGKRTKVINKISYKNTEKCYKLSFKGKTFEEEIVCDKDHFWRVYFDDTSSVLTAEQIYDLKKEVFLKRQSFNTLVDNWGEVIKLVSIEEVEPVNVSCVEVENKDHSFLCGKNFIPTMNCGKALALDTKIPTPTGWTTMGELKVGDEVLSPSGDSVKVLTKTDPMYDHKCYKIYFDNGEEIVADADHLWEVCKNKQNSKKEIITTEQLVEKYKNKTSKSVVNSYYINVSNSINCFTKKELPIDPYLLGVWLGDGYSAGGRIIAHKNDFEFYKTKIDNIGHIADSNNCYRFNVIDLHSKLRQINLIKNKHIPQDYLRSSHKDRLEILRGLMDTDGSLRPNSRSFEFYQKNYDLILQVIELLASLGIKSRTRIKKIKDCLYYTVSFNTDEIVFNLPRKKNLIKKIDKPLYRNKRVYIQKIEEVESVPVACISVDSEDELFLCGNSFIPTHNSTTAVSFLLHYAIFNENISIAILANKASTAKDLLGRLQVSFENLPNWMQQGIKSWNKTSLELENGSKIITASTSASSVRGGSYNIIFLDEFAFVPNNVALNFMNSVYPTISSGKDSKVIVVSCVTKDTYLLTDKGYRRLERLIDESKKGAYYTNNYIVRGKNRFYSGNIVVNNKKSPTNIIKTRYEELECSEDHKLWAFKEGKYQYVRSNDLSVGDFIAVKYNQQIFGNDDYIGYNPEKGKCTNCFSCDYVNEDIAYFVGLYVAEGYAREVISKRTGSLTMGQIVISCGDDITESLNKLGVSYQETDEVHYTINSKHLVEFLKLLGFNIKNKATQKVLPDKVLSWSKKNITALLRGMFDGDGGVTKNGRVAYTSTSRELIRQVQLLLANLGIIGTVRKNISAPTKLVKVYSTRYTIEIEGSHSVKYFEEIGFGLKRKHDRICHLKIPRKIGSNSDFVPNSAVIIRENKNREIHELGLFIGRGKKFKNFSRGFLISHKEKIYEHSNEILKEFFDDNVQEDMYWLEIKSIEKSENEVFDVSLPDIKEDKWAHSVLYNNFLGHQTPNGLNHFYKMWDEAIKKENDYIPLEINWNDVPGRDDEWKRKTIANLGSQKAFDQEFNCSFLGSSDTLISGAKLQTLVHNKPIKSKKFLDTFEEPIEEHQYMITVDVARGVDLDYSAFTVIDITKMPYKMVAKYRDNTIKPIMFPYIVKDVGLHYNKAFVLCETNDVGDQVANALHYDLQYPNLLTCFIKGRQGQILGQGFGGNRVEYGVKMSKNVKKLGSINLKMLIEEDKLLINDYDTINELSTFIQKSNSFMAEEGKNDDLVACLILFAWASTNEYFKEITDDDIRKRLFQEKQANEENDMLPIGFLEDGLQQETFVEDDKIWSVVSNEELAALWNFY